MGFKVIYQNQLDVINQINDIKLNGAYVTLSTYNDVSTICQYSERYDSFKIIDVPTSKLNDKLEFFVNRS